MISKLLPNLGTHDGTVVVTPATGAATVDITEELVAAVSSESPNLTLPDSTHASGTYQCIFIFIHP